MRARKLEGEIFQSSGEKCVENVAPARAAGTFVAILLFIMKAFPKTENLEKLGYTLMWVPGFLVPVLLFFYLTSSY